jgi:hypothetical protein
MNNEQLNPLPYLPLEAGKPLKKFLGELWKVLRGTLKSSQGNFGKFLGELFDPLQEITKRLKI